MRHLTAMEKQILDLRDQVKDLKSHKRALRMALENLILEIQMLGNEIIASPEFSARIREAIDTISETKGGG